MCIPDRDTTLQRLTETQCILSQSKATTQIAISTLKNDQELEKRSIQAALARLDVLLSSLPQDENSRASSNPANVLESLKQLETRLEYHRNKWVSELHMANVHKEKLQRQVRELKGKLKQSQ